MIPQKNLAQYQMLCDLLSYSIRDHYIALTRHRHHPQSPATDSTYHGVPAGPCRIMHTRHSDSTAPFPVCSLDLSYSLDTEIQNYDQKSPWLKPPSSENAMDPPRESDAFQLRASAYLPAHTVLDAEALTPLRSDLFHKQVV